MLILELEPTHAMPRSERFTHQAALTPLVMYVRQPINYQLTEAQNDLPTATMHSSFNVRIKQTNYGSTSNSPFHTNPRKNVQRDKFVH